METLLCWDSQSNSCSRYIFVEDDCWNGNVFLLLPYLEKQEIIIACEIIVLFKQNNPDEEEDCHNCNLKSSFFTPSFRAQMLKVPRVAQRLKAMLFRREFNPSELVKVIEAFNLGCKEVSNSKALQRILEVSASLCSCSGMVSMIGKMMMMMMMIILIIMKHGSDGNIDV